MKVAYLVNQYPRTSHSFIRREIQAVEALGVEVLRFSLRPLDQELVTPADREELARTRMVLAAGPGGHAAALLRECLVRPSKSIRALRLALRLGWCSERGILRHLAYLAEACVLAGWLREEAVDHLHVHFGTNAAAVAMLCRELGGPAYSLTVHGPEEFDRPEALKLGEKVRGSVFAVAISDFARSQLYRWIRLEDWRKVHVVRCGLDRELLEAPAKPVPTGPRLVCVGRLSEQKGHLLLLEAAARLAGEGVPFELVLVGDGPLRPEIERRLRADGLASRVRLAGWMGAPEVRQAILESRALVLASFAEGLPIVLMEALALGRPVVTTSIAGVPELVQSGVSGWLVPAGLVEALTEALRAVLAAPPETLERMGRAGAERVARLHDARNEARKLVASFGAAITASGAARRSQALR